jgi:hypothetical protein
LSIVGFISPVHGKDIIILLTEQLNFIVIINNQLFIKLQGFGFPKKDLGITDIGNSLGLHLTY